MIPAPVPHRRLDSSQFRRLARIEQKLEGLHSLGAEMILVLDINRLDDKAQRMRGFLDPADSLAQRPGEDDRDGHGIVRMAGLVKPAGVGAVRGNHKRVLREGGRDGFGFKGRAAEVEELIDSRLAVLQDRQARRHAEYSRLLAELVERLDFAERILAGQRPFKRLDAPEESDIPTPV